VSEPARDNLVSIDPVVPHAAPEAQAAPPRDRRPLWIGALLGLAVLVLCMLYVQETRRADALEAEVTRLDGELQASRDTVQAYRGHLDRVRGQVGDLSSRFEALRDLVESDPETPSDGAEGDPGAGSAPLEGPGEPPAPGEAL
jgi:hypothetical protein